VAGAALHGGSAPPTPIITKPQFAELDAHNSGPPPSPNLGVVMGPDFAQLAANLGRNLMEGRIGILTAVFEAA